MFMNSSVAGFAADVDIFKRIFLFFHAPLYNG